MKRTKHAIIGAGVLLFACAFHSFAVDGLQLSVQSTDVMLSWPSVEGETYVVQYRHTLDPADSWQTLAAGWPAATGTNITSFIHYGIVQYPPAGSGGFAIGRPPSFRARLRGMRPGSADDYPPGPPGRCVRAGNSSGISRRVPRLPPRGRGRRAPASRPRRSRRRARPCRR